VEDYRCIDIPGQEQHYMESDVEFAHKGIVRVEVFNGKSVPQDRIYDVVLFNFVLHHAAHNVRSLIKSALVVGRLVVIQEDIPDGTEEVTEGMCQHDPKAIFRSVDQWVALFKMHGAECCFKRDLPPGDVSGYRVPRVLMAFASRG
jgi:hypothetical protein